jgi:hypothetical protein
MLFMYPLNQLQSFAMESGKRSIIITSKTHNNQHCIILIQVSYLVLMFFFLNLILVNNLFFKNLRVKLLYRVRKMLIL